MGSLETGRFPPRQSSLPSPPRTADTARPPVPSSLASFSSLLALSRNPRSATSPVKRKPLPPDSPALRINKSPDAEHDSGSETPIPATQSEASSPLLVRDLDQFPRGHSPLFPSRSFHRKPINAGKGGRRSNSSATQPPLSSPKHSRGQSAPLGSVSVNTRPSFDFGMGKSKAKPAAFNTRPPPLEVQAVERRPSHGWTDSKQPRTPGNKITQFFNWKRTHSPNEEADDSSSTEPSDHGFSAVPSPLATSPQTSRYSARSFPHGLDIYKSDIGRGGALASPFVHPSVESHNLAEKIDQLESELKEITCELAGSIKREMDLEDLVEKFQAEVSGAHDENRISDYYYSDSSTGSARLSGSEGLSKQEDLQKVKRQAEQERGRLKVELSQRWQEEISRRALLESHVQSLEIQLSQGQATNAESSQLSTKYEVLEASLEQTRRGLVEERAIKEGLEGQLNLLRGQIESDRLEHEQLRDEVVPQLQAKLSANHIEPGTGLESDITRLQEEIKALRYENAVLKETRKLQPDGTANPARFHSISEEEDAVPTCLTPTSPPLGVSRSNSLARAAGGRNRGLARSGSLSRSDSIGGKSPVDGRESLAERMKDMELQRDALHSAMKALLTRQDCQSKEFQKQIRALEQERDNLALPSTPRRLGYEAEVQGLRDEINRLRRRADDAIAQKMQCEKGLGGLKMDMDRSEQETSTLRKLLQEHDVMLPDKLCNSLQDTYDRLEEDRRSAAAFVQGDASSRSAEETQLAEQLKESAESSEELAQQMARQMATNQALRDRLSHTIGQGEKNQTASTQQITELETKLRTLEETVQAAQQSSEIGVAAHEDEVRTLKEAHNAQLQRLKSVTGYRSPTSPQPQPQPQPPSRHGLSPLVSPLFSQRTPRLEQTSSGQGMRLEQAVKMEQLETKVVELETALENTDREMQEVVGRMNTAQIEVMQLQTERDDVLKQSKKLETAMSNEREKIRSLLSRSQAS